MRHVARDATRLLEAKFSDGMCREAGPDSYAKGEAKGEDPERAMTNDKPVKNRAGWDDIAMFGVERW